MNVPRFSLTHKATVWILLALILAVGVYNYFTISQREDPEFKISLALVITIWPGASAEKMERLVTQKIEEKVEEINTVEEITSTTRENLSVIIVRMVYDCDIDMAWQKLRNKITEVRPDLPDNIIGPDVMDDFGDVTAMIYSLSSETAPPAELKQWAEALKTRIKRVQSVGKVELLGEREEAIYIEGPMDSFTMYPFSPLVASRVLDMQNVNMPSGYVRTPMRNYRLEVTGSFRIEEQLANAVLDVSKETGTPLKVKDVFSVRRGYKEPPLDFMLTDSLPTVGLDIRMRDGGNLVTMGKEVREIVEEFRKTLPKHIRLELAHDQPRQVDNFVGTFMTNLFEGLIIVILVMFLSMGARSATLIAFSLPLSIILTFAVMPLFGVDLETVSIAAFIIALGMLVDNAIIVTDNIDVHLSQGESPFEAAWKGTRELSIPALTGTLATVLAFLPLLLLSEETGDYIRSLPIVVSASLLASLVLAVTITPIVAHTFLKPRTNGNNASESPEGRASRAYRSLIGGCLKYRKSVIFITTSVFVGAMALLPIVGFSFFPEAERDQFTINIWLPEGSSLQHTENVTRQVLDRLREEKHVSNTVAYIGKGGPRFYMTIKPEFNATNYAQVVASMDDAQYTRPFVEQLNEEFRRNIAGARIVVENLSMGVPVEAPIALRITGSDITTLKTIAEQLKTILRSTKGSYLVRDNGGEDVPNLEVRVDSEAALMAGITSTDVALAFISTYEGLPVTKLREGDEEIPVYFRLVESERTMADSLQQIAVPSQVTKAKVPLGAFADIHTQWGPGVIKRHKGQRAFTVLSGCHNRLASDILNEIRPAIEALDLPDGYSIESIGEEKERNKSFGEMLIIFALIIALILLMLVIQFNSISKALVILASVPLAIVGAILGLLASGNSFAFMPFLGVISLAGMVIKNAVVWVEFVQKAVEDGHDLRHAIIQAGRQRLRPIVLTAATTIGGLIPLALFGGILWEGMAYAMIFGLAVSTVLTLVVIPVIYFVAFGKDSAKVENASLSEA